MSNDLKKLLVLYRAEVKKYLMNHNKTVIVTLTLDDKFLKECESRIVEGHKKYGNDYRTKDCLREIDFEKFDIFNYKMLDECQKSYLNKKNSVKSRLKKHNSKNV